MVGAGGYVWISEFYVIIIMMIYIMLNIFTVQITLILDSSSCPEDSQLLQNNRSYLKYLFCFILQFKCYVF